MLYATLYASAPEHLFVGLFEAKQGKIVTQATSTKGKQRHQL